MMARCSESNRWCSHHRWWRDRHPASRSTLVAVIAVQKLRIRSGIQTVTLTVSRLPKFAGMDPFDELIDRNSEATITKVASR
jgi:hypothetical protein